MGGKSISEEFVEQSVFRMKESTERIEKCLSLLSLEQVWAKPNRELNSVGNLVLHLEGNITQYVLSSLGGAPDIRDRELEFAAQTLNKEVLLSRISNCFEKAKEVVENVSPEDLKQLRTVQGFELSGVGIITHVVEHYSYHVGQISLLTKFYTNQDLGYYANFDLNITNE